MTPKTTPEKSSYYLMRNVPPPFVINKILLRGEGISNAASRAAEAPLPNSGKIMTKIADEMVRGIVYGVVFESHESKAVVSGNFGIRVRELISLND
jgi:hypothetical protein